MARDVINLPTRQNYTSLQVVGLMAFSPQIMMRRYGPGICLYFRSMTRLLRPRRRHKLDARHRCLSKSNEHILPLSYRYVHPPCFATERAVSIRERRTTMRNVLTMTIG